MEPGPLAPGKDDAPLPAALLEQALEIHEREGRAAFEAFCAAHPDAAGGLRLGLQRLIAAGFVTGDGTRAPEAAPRTLGRYRIVRQLGAGGMGIVHLARDEVLQRDVALKTLPLHRMTDARTRERFEREVRAVAQLHHPGIVPVFEVGEAEGVPYFTMEYVPGLTLAELLDRLRAAGVSPQELSDAHVRELTGAGDSGVFGRNYVECVCRITIQIASALEHAHAHGVLHRDVKPGNVLVSSDGRVRLFDFGLARVEEEQTLTRTGDFVGTSAYVAPEQIGGYGATVDARSDVYALGVTLYELLTLRTPFRGRNAQIVMRQILTSEAEAPRRVNPHVPPDLETVCMTALEKDPRRRYAGPAALAEDLQRVLQFKPIRARPASRLTRAARMVRRHPARALAAALAALLLLGAPIGLALSNQRIRAERDTADRVLQAFIEIFKLADIEELGPDVPARTLLENGARRTLLDEPLLQQDPRARGRVMTTIGSLFWMMGRYERAEELLRGSLAIQRAELGELDRDTASTRNFLGNLLRSESRLPEAEEHYRSAFATLTELDDEGDEFRTVIENLASLLLATGRHAEAETHAQRNLALERAQPSSKPGRLGEALMLLGQVYTEAGRLDDAHVFLDEATTALAGEHMLPRQRGNAHLASARLHVLRGDLELVVEERKRGVACYVDAFGERSVPVGSMLVMLGDAHMNIGDLASAEGCFRRAQQSLEHSIGVEHVEYAYACWGLSEALRQAQELEEALEWIARAENIYCAPASRAGPATLANLAFQHARICAELGRHTEAAQLAQHSLALAPPDGPAAADALILLGAACASSGHAEEGEPFLREGYELQQRLRRANVGIRLAPRGALGECLARQGRFAEAEAWLRASLESFDPTGAHDLAGLRLALRRLDDLYRSWGRPADAAAFADRLVELE